MNEPEQQLIELLEARIKGYQATINDLTKEMTMAMEYLATLKKKSTRDVLITAPPISIGVKVHTEGIYTDKSMTVAIMDMLLSHQNEWLNAATIYNELVNGGYESKSSNIKRDVYVRLYRMEKKGSIDSKEEGGTKLYRAKRKGENLLQ